ncbi:MAG: LuxR C-terminal-related transcriptional regulator [bacterium]|nr:LuxR C-terminal-related transcriptional regulator [bacterium]
MQYFTKREYQTLLHYLEGKDLKNTAENMEVTHATVESFKRSVRTKLGCKTDYAIPAAVIAEFGLDFYLNIFASKMGKSIVFSQLTEKEVRIIQFLMYDFTMVELESLKPFGSSISYYSLPKLLNKAQVESFPELVAVLLQANRVKVPVRIDLARSA